METAPLKSFATWARTALIREVNARIAAVLAPGSSKRVEQTRAVSALEMAVAGAGGGDKGRAAVANKVAYTWFNRIIALRFMDANGYTAIGVVSPPAGVDVGQPEILAEAKRGVFDTDTVSQKARARVSDLLDGTQPSDDPQGEAYALLLASQCRFWNGAMPFMFEREGDYTELLIPANLLADDSVLNRSVKVLTKDVCKDVEVIGWLYQFYIADRKSEVFAGFKKGKKAGAGEIPAATQLFTPHWIVRYLVENSLGHLWMLNHPSSGLVNQMDYYIAPVDKASSFLEINTPEELKVIDPACGSGHMLTYAFDLLYAIYEEEGYSAAEIPGLILTHNLHGTEIDPRAGALAAFALAMKARGKQRTFFNTRVEPNICVTESISFGPDELDILITEGGDRDVERAFWNQFEHAETFGALIRPDSDLTLRLAGHLGTLDDSGDMLRADALERAAKVIRQSEILTPRYSVVVANPPYMGGGNMNQSLSAFAKSEYPVSKADLFAMFIDRAIALVVRHGLVGMITMQAWAFLSSYEKLRSAVLAASKIETFAHLGVGAFDSIGGAVVSTAAFVLSETPDDAHAGIYVQLTNGRNETEKRQLLRDATSSAGHSLCFQIRPAALKSIPGSPLAYWVSDGAVQTIIEMDQLGNIAMPRAGLQTNDNNRFLRQWWEPSLSRIGFDMPDRRTADVSGRRWFPCQKGGPFRRWFGNHDLVVNWEHDGSEILTLATDLYGSPTRTAKNMQFYFRAGGTWSTISGNSFAMRWSPPGFISETKGSTCFADSEELIRNVIAYANSTTADYFLGLSSPTLDFHEGPVARLPFEVAKDKSVVERANRCIEIAQADWDSREESWQFTRSVLLKSVGDLEPLRDVCARAMRDGTEQARELRTKEIANNEYFAENYGVKDAVVTEVNSADISLFCNPEFMYRALASGADRETAARKQLVADLVSYAVGCMFGRYSLDQPGLILADQGGTVQDYLMAAPSPTFQPDADNVVPIVDGDWFEDDILDRFRGFLLAAFGQRHFEENLRFVTEALGVKTLRDYFVTKAGKSKFYDDHVQRYKKRPIYWLFSSPKGSFNALIYMHRYTPSTVSTVLNEYLREFQAKLKASLEQAELSNKAKEADVLRKKLVELDAYEHDVLYPLASQQIAIDLDDGVKVNYPKFGKALKKIPGLEAKE
ncbi:BREX-1 system adenine-specific DNA-methyltransferase PglX [Gordonia sp. SND2]|uniref:BREX-1 system adenine-specific DNA-methyltransferase PglX n=1 Tax=Gordonia sp. SND2 TaxID=3388659 RepID=UPI00398AC04F